MSRPMDEESDVSSGPKEIGNYKLIMITVGMAVFLLFISGVTFAFRHQIKQMMHVNVEAQQETATPRQ